MLSKINEKLEEASMVQFMGKFDKNPFLLRFKGREYPIGAGVPRFVVDFKEVIPVSELLNSTSIALGEAYMDGKIEIEGNLYEALDAFLGQMGKFSTDETALKKLIHTSLSKKNQEKEVTSHYDIGNDFYKLWLDETLSYSCAYFKNPEDTLYQAQVNKADYILQKLNLKEGMSLLDIGCGWGYLLIEAVKKYKVKGTGITLSQEQYKEFQTVRQSCERWNGGTCRTGELPAFYRQCITGYERRRRFPAAFYQCLKRASGRRMDQEIYFSRRGCTQS